MPELMEDLEQDSQMETVEGPESTEDNNEFDGDNEILNEAYKKLDTSPDELSEAEVLMLQEKYGNEFVQTKLEKKDRVDSEGETINNITDSAQLLGGTSQKENEEAPAETANEAEEEEPSKEWMLDKINQALGFGTKANVTDIGYIDYASETHVIRGYSANFKLKDYNADLPIDEITVDESNAATIKQEAYSFKEPLNLFGTWAKFKDLKLSFEEQGAGYALKGKGDLNIELARAEGKAESAGVTISKDGTQTEIDSLEIEDDELLKYEIKKIDVRENSLFSPKANVTLLEESEKAYDIIKPLLNLDKGLLENVDFSRSIALDVDIDGMGIHQGAFIPFVPLIKYSNEAAGISGELDIANSKGSISGEWKFPSDEIPGIWPVDIGIEVPAGVPGIYVFGGVEVGGGLGIKLGAELKKEEELWNIGAEAGINGEVNAAAEIGVGLGSRVIVAIEAALQAKAKAEAHAKGGIEGKLRHDSEKGMHMESPLSLSYNLGAELSAAVNGVVRARAFYIFKKKLYELKLEEWNLGKFVMKGKAEKGEDGKYQHTDKEWKFESDIKQPKFGDPYPNEAAQKLLLEAVDIIGSGEARREFAERAKFIQKEYLGFLKKMEGMIDTKAYKKAVKDLDKLGDKVAKAEMNVEKRKGNIKTGKASKTSIIKSAFRKASSMDIEKEKLQKEEAELREAIKKYNEDKEIFEQLPSEVNNAINITELLKQMEKMPDEKLEKGEGLEPYMKAIRHVFENEQKYKEKRELVKKKFNMI